MQDECDGVKVYNTFWRNNENVSPTVEALCTN